MATTVLIVDDHAGFRAGARRLLEADGFEVIGTAPDARSGLDASRAMQPDVVLSDIQLPDLDGFVLAQEITGSGDGPAVVLTSTRSVSEYGSLIYECGARGFLSKAQLSGSALEELLR